MPHPDTKEDLYNPTHGAKVPKKCPSCMSVPSVCLSVCHGIQLKLRKLDHYPLRAGLCYQDLQSFFSRNSKEFTPIDGVKCEVRKNYDFQPISGCISRKQCEIRSRFRLVLKSATLDDLGRLLRTFRLSYNIYS